MPKGYKRGKGVPALHDELKTRVNLALTPTGIKGLDTLADNLNISRSELVERIGRGLIPIATFPSVPLREGDILPNRPGVYLVMEGDRILYIGHSQDLKKGWLDRSSLPQFEVNSDNLRITWVECGDRDLVQKLENLLIEALKPSLNGAVGDRASSLDVPLKNPSTISVNIPVDFLVKILASVTTVNYGALILSTQPMSPYDDTQKIFQADHQQYFLTALLTNLQQFIQEWETKIKG